jgi:murein DD-endopeptidase MepM/ murein hydrolase activator NlpD
MIRTLGRLAGLLLVLASIQANAQSFQITVVPAVVEAGSPVLLHVEAPAGAIVEGNWLGRKLQFFPAGIGNGRIGHGWFALAGVDVEAATGPSEIEISIRSGNDVRKLSRAVEIHPAHYRTGSLTVAPKFVEPDAASLEEIKTEVELKAKIFAASASEPLWSSSFHAPVATPPTDSFGTRRMFNGKLASVHKGMDFHAATGTPVHAANSGVVVLARPLYYEGNCVAIDHGLGLYTISMHLSRIDVEEGHHVAAGERIGLSGATGRATGPHLHWAVRWRDAYLDPAKLLRLDLSAVR